MGTSHQIFVRFAVDDHFRALRQLHQAAGRHRVGRSAGVLRIDALQFHVVNRGIVDHFNPIPPIPIVAAENIEPDRRHHTFEHVGEFLLLTVRACYAHAAHVVAPLGAFVGSIAHLHRVGQFESACQIGDRRDFKVGAFGDFPNAIGGKILHAHMVVSWPQQRFIQQHDALDPGAERFAGENRE